MTPETWLKKMTQKGDKYIVPGVLALSQKQTESGWIREGES